MQPAGTPVLSLEELVKRTKPAVVYLKALDRAGSGFFVTDTGVIAINAHLARGESSFLAILSSGAQLEAKVVYVDADLDIALAKINSTSPGFLFPSIALADAATVRQGESVLAIGNPGDAMLFGVTQGIVAPWVNFPPLVPAPGSKPMRPSIREIPAARSSTCAAKSSALTPKSSSRKT